MTAKNSFEAAFSAVNSQGCAPSIPENAASNDALTAVLWMHFDFFLAEFRQVLAEIRPRKTEIRRGRNSAETMIFMFFAQINMISTLK